MAGRFSLKPLLRGLIQGVRHREEGKSTTEKTDVVAVCVLFGVPAATLAATLVLQIELVRSDQLLAGAALLAGALLTAFAQVAVWRERLLGRLSGTHASQIRALNEAATHILVSLVSVIVATVAVVLLGSIDSTSLPVWMDWLPGLLHWAEGGRHWTGVILSALAAAAFAYVVVSLLIVVNLLWDAYGEEQKDSKRESLRDLGES